MLGADRPAEPVDLREKTGEEVLPQSCRAALRHDEIHVEIAVADMAERNERHVGRQRGEVSLEPRHEEGNVGDGDRDVAPHHVAGVRRRLALAFADAPHHLALGLALGEGTVAASPVGEQPLDLGLDPFPEAGVEGPGDLDQEMPGMRLGHRTAEAGEPLDGQFDPERADDLERRDQVAEGPAEMPEERDGVVERPDREP